MTLEIAVNQGYLDMEYAVRGPIPAEAARLRQQGRVIVPCNIGNPQDLGQQPVDAFRQVISLVESPALIGREEQLIQREPRGSELIIFSAAALQLAEHILNEISREQGRDNTGTGAYSQSRGYKFIREAIAKFIDRRDSVYAGKGVPSNPDNIFLTNGASKAIEHIIPMLIAAPSDGVMCPMPAYPLYTALIVRSGGKTVPYFLHEESGWTLKREDLEDAYQLAGKSGVTPKLFILGNPNNPASSILDRDTLEEVIQFCLEHNLAIISDEVYQENTYGGQFVSAANVLGERPVLLFSLHSTSKGYVGECGKRGGYVEIRNPLKVAGTSLTIADVLLKDASASLCSNTIGQILVYLMVEAANPENKIYGLVKPKKDAILASLHERAGIIRSAFAEMQGLRCYGQTAAMYLFPNLGEIPRGDERFSADFNYCIELLRQTGLCTVNGAGFGQMPGTNHLRTTFLPPKELLASVLPKWVEFHNAYVKGEVK